MITVKEAASARCSRKPEMNKIRRLAFETVITYVVEEKGGSVPTVEDVQDRISKPS